VSLFGQGAGFECSAEDDTHTEENEPWKIEKLRAYISIVKDRFRPRLGADAAHLLERHYEKCRMAESSTIPVTVRFLESMIRLSQAHARLMYRNDVLLEDAVAVVRIMECSAFAYGGFDGGVDDVENILYEDPMTMDFSTRADLEFLAFMYRVLERYGLLDRMPDDKQKKVLEYLRKEVSDASHAWNDVEHQRDVMAPAVEKDHYGRYYFPNPFQRPHEGDSGGTNHQGKRQRTDEYS